VRLPDHAGVLQENGGATKKIERARSGRIQNRHHKAVGVVSPHHKGRRKKVKGL
jgi:hypothetical protein